MSEVPLLGWLPSMPSWRSMRCAVKRLSDCSATPTVDGHSDLLSVVGVCSDGRRPISQTGNLKTLRVYAEHTSEQHYWHGMAHPFYVA